MVCLSLGLPHHILLRLRGFFGGTREVIMSCLSQLLSFSLKYLWCLDFTPTHAECLRECILSPLSHELLMSMIVVWITGGHFLACQRIWEMGLLF